MAGGPGAAGGPASSARSPPRPALAGFRVGRAGGWRPEEEAGEGPPAPSRARPAYLGHGGAPEAAAPAGPERSGSVSLPGAAPLPLWSRSTPKKGRWRAPGVGRRPPSSRGLSRAASAGRGSSPPPAASSHAALRTSARRTLAARRTCGLDPAFPEGGRAAGLGCPGRSAGGGKARPRSRPARRPQRLCSLRGLQRCSPGAGGEMEPVCFFFHAALHGREGKSKRNWHGRKGMKKVGGPGSQKDITSGIAHLAQSCFVSQGR